MRLIVVSPYPLVPSVSGGRLRSRHLVQQLLDRGHSVDNWVVSGPDEPPGPWPVPAPRLTTHHLPGRVRAGRLSKLAAVASPYHEGAWACPPPEMTPAALEGVDLAVLCQAHVGRFMAPFRRHGLPVLLSTHNVEADLARQLASIAPTRPSRLQFRLDAWKLRTFETRLMTEASLVTAVSPVDAQKLQAMAPSVRIEVIPSGADVARTAYVDHTRLRSDRLVLVGTLGYLPNLDAARWLVEAILPLVRRKRSNAHAALVGSSPPSAMDALVGPGVELVGPVEDIADELAASDVFVAPLRAASGVRIKLLDAFAHGIPVVATSIAAEGLEVRDGVHLELADDAASIADAIVRLLEDADRRSRLAACARELVEERYDWRVIGERYEALLTSVALNGATS